MLINTNEILFRIQKALKLSIEEILKTYKLENHEMSEEHLVSLLKRRQEKDFILCSYEELGIFLDALVTLKRGASPKKQNNETYIKIYHIPLALFATGIWLNPTINQ